MKGSQASLGGGMPPLIREINGKTTVENKWNGGLKIVFPFLRRLLRTLESNCSNTDYRAKQSDSIGQLKYFRTTKGDIPSSVPHHIGSC